uniref:glycoside hydrolase family 88/105 protein n=1 Tax=uncultured Dysgonomonas sp. TaxID=206096 RepID=UPI00260CF7B6|nr:glycoside hydrolase family 88 protein [uncultured Dysgonomonas sp.]
MRKFRTFFLFLIPLFTFSYIGCSNNKTATRSESNLPTRTEVVEIIQKVNGNWQASHPNHENSFWHRAAYHTGNMAAYEVTKIEDYKAYSKAWAEHNLWMGAQSNDTSKWKYSYGESDEYVLFGDFQTCFQVYIDLYNLNLDEKKIARAKQVMEYQMSTPNNDYWWWADGLYMAMPVMTKLYKLTNNELYLDKLYEYFSFARDLMYDSESKLFYRDAKYIYPKHKTDNGLKDFWARGNGWVFAAMPKTLENLPETNNHRAEYIKIYQDMASAIADSQQEDGSWTRSMLDPQHAPGPETSGTAFFTYGFLWGINNGILDKATYLPVAERSWKYLSETALQPDGKIGYVQPIGEKAIPGQVVDVNSTADFGVGAFLLAASELVKYLDKQQ